VLDVFHVDTGRKAGTNGARSRGRNSFASWGDDDMTARIGGLVFGMLVAATAATGCAVEPASDGADTGFAPTPGAPAAPLTESDRVRHLIDARYAASDVRHSFQTQSGEHVDCIDYDAQKSVRDLRARGIYVPPQPEAIAPVRVGDAGRELLTELLDDNGDVRSCPSGTVPQRRLTPERIARAGGVDGFLAAAHDKAPIIHSDGCPANSVYSWVTATLDTPEPVSMGTSTMAIFKPTLPSNAWSSHSLSETWMTTGSGSDCSGSTIQSVEIGWHVHEAYEGDYNPHIFIFATNDGYRTTGCYNDNYDTSERGASNGPLTCLPFVLTSSYVFPSLLLPASSAPPNEAEYELVTTTQAIVQAQSSTPIGWSITLQENYIAPNGAKTVYWTQPLGYYPSSAFYGQMSSGQGTLFEVGGEVEDLTGQATTFTNVEMGSGARASAGLGYAAYHHDFFAQGAARYTTYSIATTGSSDYGYMQADGTNGWANAFYYGASTPLRYCPPWICHFQF
jgi:hypothetical protein